MYPVWFKEPQAGPEAHVVNGGNLEVCRKQGKRVIVAFIPMGLDLLLEDLPPGVDDVLFLAPEVVDDYVPRMPGLQELEPLAFRHSRR